MKNTSPQHPDRSPAVIVRADAMRHAHGNKHRILPDRTILEASSVATPENFEASLTHAFPRDAVARRRVLAAYTAMKGAFDSLRGADGQPKKRRSGEALYLHSAGVAKMLMDEFGEKDTDLLVEALYHDFGEDILWDRIAVKPGKAGRLLESKMLSKALLPYVARTERRRLEQELHDTEHLETDNAHVVSVLSIDKKLAKAFPDHNLYLEQIATLRDPALRSRAAKIRIADKIYNLRSGEPDLTDGKQWDRLAKQTKAAIEFTLPIAGMIPEDERGPYLAKLQEAIGYALMRLEQHAMQAGGKRAAHAKALWALFASSVGENPIILGRRIREEVATTFAKVLDTDGQRLNGSSSSPSLTA